MMGSNFYLNEPCFKGNRLHDGFYMPESFATTRNLII